MDEKRFLISASGIGALAIAALAGGGALAALDFYASGSEVRYKWHPQSREWEPIKPLSITVAAISGDSK